MFHYPALIKSNMNITTPATTADFLPTIMAILQVTTDNPTWATDGIDLAPIVELTASTASAASSTASLGGASSYIPREKEMGFWTGGQQSVIDNNWKILRNPGVGQCSGQAPYYAPKPWTNFSKTTFLFNLDTDYHELHDLSASEPEQFERMSTLLENFLASVENSQANETKCGKYGPPSPAPPTPAPGPLPPARTDCKWTENTGQVGSDIAERKVASKEECCSLCWADSMCKAADFTGEHLCHLKGTNEPVHRADGSVSCVPLKNRTEAGAYWAQFD
jgi:hypothetical protein